MYFCKGGSEHGQAGVVVDGLLQVEIGAWVAAPKRKHRKDRKIHYSVYREARLHNRVETMHLVIPKVRKWSYLPFFMVDRKRSESALLRLVREDFVNGASTGKIERLAKGLGIEGTSASKVSEITRGLDKRVEDFRTRPLQAEYSFIWVDVLLWEGTAEKSGYILSHKHSGRSRFKGTEEYISGSADVWGEGGFLVGVY